MTRFGKAVVLVMCLRPSFYATSRSLREKYLDYRAWTVKSCANSSFFGTSTVTLVSAYSSESQAIIKICDPDGIAISNSPSAPLTIAYSLESPFDTG